MRWTVELDYETSVELLSSIDIGRVALSAPTGPQILPVSYVVADGTVIFRTSPHSVLGSYAWNSLLAVEADLLDADDTTGWTVVATGRGTTIDDPDDLAGVQALWDPDRWPTRQRHVYVRLPLTTLTGRRFSRT